MYTDADRHLDSARKHIQQAVEEMAEVFIKECSGHDEYTREKRTQWEMTFYELARLRNRLD